MLLSSIVKAELANSNATDWLKLIDNGSYQNSWNNASQHFKSEVSEGNWVSMVQSAREPLGALLTRKMVSSSTYEDLPNLPKGHYQIVIYSSNFEHMNDATETVTLIKVGNQWKAAGYFIKQTQSALQGT